MYFSSHKDLKVGTFPTLEILAPGLSLLFFSRAGGVSPAPYNSLNLGLGVGDLPGNVEKNRAAVIKHLGVAPPAIATMDQVHGTGIKIIKSGGIQPETDGMITMARDIALVVSTADCYPVFLYSPSERVLAALHVGRAGASGGIIGKAFDILKDSFSIDIRNTLAIAGPGICGKCYTVSESDAAAFPPEVAKERKDGWHLDLARFCALEFARAGIQKQNILFSNICTSCYGELCFSYRRDGGATGRHWTVAMISSTL
ncbi:MAG: laccase domain-containing protein [Candidatus Krumholzibacteriota bacterium]|nr:laccase domain-containing protein [Candidatus Krumholzibacteriota bacterium]